MERIGVTCAPDDANLTLFLHFYRYPAKEQQIMVSKVMAWCNQVAVAVSNASGFDGVYSK